MTGIFISEIHYDNTGADSGEAVEVTFPTGISLTGYSIVFYNGTGGASYGTALLASGTVSDLGNGFSIVSIPFAGIQNGTPDGIALVGPGSTVIQFLSYEGTMTATNGPANGLTSTDIGVIEDGTGAVGTSLQLTGTGTFYADFTWTTGGTSTFGAANNGQTLTRDVVDGTVGDDVILGDGNATTFSADTLNGGDGNDSLQGRKGQDILNGGAGDDILSGGSEADTMTGGLGNDLHVIDNAGDVVIEAVGEGTDDLWSIFDIDLTSVSGGNFENGRLQGTAINLTGNAEANRLFGNASNNVINAGDGIDVLNGGAGDDLLNGGAGNDSLTGGLGSDTLNGGEGKDLMFGNDGADVFDFAAGDFAGLTAATADRIRDFSQAQGDLIDLADAGASSFIGSAAFSGSAGEVRAQAFATYSMVFGDTNGDSVADYAIRVDGSVTLASNDFVFSVPI